MNVKKTGGNIIISVEYADCYSAKGYSQGICKLYEKGKIIILAQSALLTAQFHKNGNKYGRNSANEDNKQFVLNTIRWLAIK